jgi:hypothetical protein
LRCASERANLTCGFWMLVSAGPNGDTRFG